MLEEIGCSPKSRAWTKRPGRGVGGATGAARATAWRRSASRRKKDLALEQTLEAVVQPETAGDPMSEQTWVRSSLRHLSERLKDAGHPASPPTVGRLLRKLGYSLRVNVKKHEASAAHPDRHQQFEVIESQKQAFQAAGWPIISVDSREERVDWQRAKTLGEPGVKKLRPSMCMTFPTMP